MILMRLSRGQIVEWGIFFLLLFLPLVYFPFVFNSYELPKFILFIFIVSFLFVTFITGNNFSHFRFDFLTILVLSFGLLVYIANIFGLDPATSFLGSKFRHQGFITLLSGILLFLLVHWSLGRTKKTLDFYKKALLLSIIPISFIALYHAVAFYIFHNYQIPIYQGRIVGTFGNPNFLGGYLAVLLPFVFFISWNKKNFWQIILIGMILVVILLTRSRSAMLGVGFVLFVYWFSVIINSKTWRKFVPIIIGIVLLSFLYNGYQKNLLIVYKYSKWDNQVVIWKEGIGAVLKRPMLGYGQENFELAISSKKMLRVDNAHNIFLETAVSSGILGLLLFLAIIIAAIWQASFVLKISIITFLITAQFNPLSIAQIALFWFFLGLSRGEFHLVRKM